MRFSGDFRTILKPVLALLCFGMVACGGSGDAEDPPDEKPQIRHPGFKQEDLWRAIRKGKPERVARLLEDGADVNAKGPDGQTALAIAVRENKRNIVRLILEKSRVEVDASDDDGMSPLMFALHPGPDESKHLESLTKPEGSWLISEILASESDYRPTSTAEYLLEAGANPNRADARGRTSIMHAHTAEKIRLAAKFGAELDAKDGKGMTALMKAVLRCNPEATSTLVALGADPKLRDSRGLDVSESLSEERKSLEQLLANRESQESRSSEEAIRRMEAQDKIDCWEMTQIEQILNSGYSS